MKLYRRCDGKFIGFVGMPRKNRLEVYLLGIPHVAFSRKIYVLPKNIKAIENFYILKLPSKRKRLYKLLIKYHKKIEELVELRKQGKMAIKEYLEQLKSYVRNLRIIEHNLNTLEKMHTKVNLRNVLRFRPKRITPSRIL